MNIFLPSSLCSVLNKSISSVVVCNSVVAVPSLFCFQLIGTNMPNSLCISKTSNENN